jgi:hypothetical protein
MYKSCTGTMCHHQDVESLKVLLSVVRDCEIFEPHILVSWRGILGFVPAEERATCIRELG